MYLLDIKEKNPEPSLLFRSSWWKLVSEQELFENIKVSKRTYLLNQANCTSPTLYFFWLVTTQTKFYTVGPDIRHYAVAADNLSHMPFVGTLNSLCACQIFKEICLCTRLETAKSCDIWYHGDFFCFNFVVLQKETTYASNLAFKFHLGNRVSTVWPK